METGIRVYLCAVRILWWVSFAVVTLSASSEAQDRLIQRKTQITAKSANLREPPCEIKELEPELIKCDSSLLMHKVQNGTKFSTEWSKVVKIKELLRDHFLKTSERCYYAAIDDLNLDLYIGKPTTGNRIGPTTPIRVFGSRVQKKPGSDDDELIRVAYPPNGAATPGIIFDNNEQDLRIFLEDFAQVELVYVPHIQQISGQGADAGSCFRITSLTLVPSRVFDEELPWSKEKGNLPAQQLPSEISLRAQKESLEYLAGQMSWMERMATEKAECKLAAQENGYSQLQVQSIQVTLKRLFPGREFLQQSSQFWTEVKNRIEHLRRWDEEKVKTLFKPANSHE